ncbi:MAG TPA: hypothetical protein GX525_00450 [Bacilli bacterium]|nr:hypothetical protein [Bacilli bacterium]
MYLNKQEIDKLLQGDLTKGRQATTEEKAILQAELMKLILKNFDYPIILSV